MSTMDDEAKAMTRPYMSTMVFHEMDRWVWFSSLGDTNACIVAAVCGENFGESDDDCFLTIAPLMEVPDHEIAKHICNLHNEDVGFARPDARMSAEPEKR